MKKDQSHYASLLYKYKKFKYRLDKAIRNGRFALYSQRKQQMLLKRIERLRRQLSQLSSSWKKGVATLATASALAITAPEASAQNFQHTKTGNETSANPTTANNQQRAVTAMASNGDYVVIWQSNGQDGDGDGIFGQYYNADGTPKGNELEVNTSTMGIQDIPAVTMDYDGNFVVAWRDVNQTGIILRRFDSNGNPLSGEIIVVNEASATLPSIALEKDNHENFVVTWQAGGDIFGQRYNGANKEGDSFQVNTYTQDVQWDASVAMDEDGDFVIAWASQDQDGDSYGIFAQRFDASGTKAGPEFNVNTLTTGYQAFPSVAMDADGDFAVSWVSYELDGDKTGIAARKFNANGTAINSNDVVVNTNTSGFQWNPAIAMDEDGDFAIAWESEIDGSYEIQVQRFNAAGNPEGIEFQVNTSNAANHIRPSIAMNPSGNFVTTWQTSVDDLDIYVQRFTVGNLAPSAPILSDTDLQDNTQPGLFSSTILATDGNIGEPPLTFSLVEGEGAEHNSLFDIYGDVLTNNQFIDYEFHGSSLNIRVRAEDRGGESTEIEVQLNMTDLMEEEEIIAIGQEFQINTYINDNQTNPSIAASDNGDFIVVWESNGQDGDGLGIYAQKHHANGTKNGDEFLVNQSTINDQKNPVVAMNEEGDFVIAWQSVDQNEGNDGIYARHYKASDNSFSDEFLVSNSTDGDQHNPDVDINQNGDFNIVWNGDGNGDTDDGGIQGQRYNSAGETNGSTFLVNDYTTGIQELPTISLNDNGYFVIAWQSRGQNETQQFHYGVFAQRFNNDGTKEEAEFNASVYTENNQKNPAVALDNEGNFVITWDGDGGDDGMNSNDEQGIHARKFTMSSEDSQQFIVNDETNDNQVTPSLAMANNGDFVITWEGANEAIYAKSYSIEGVLIKSDFVVEQDINSISNPSIAMNNIGDFLVAWHEGETGMQNVFAQRFINNQPTTELSLGNSTIQEGNTLGAVIGNLTPTDPNGDSDSYSYWLVAGDGDTDNASFSIEDNQLLANEVFDYATKSSYSARVRVIDAGGFTFDQAFTITVTKDNDAPQLTVNTGLSVDEGANAVIGTAILHATDVDNSASELLYTLTSIPANGDLHLQGVSDPLTIDDTFKQVDIDSELISYTHNGGETASDSFGFSVSDGDGGEIGETTFNITINPVNDTPELTGSIQDQTYAPGFNDAMFELNLYFTDVDGDPLTYSVTANPASLIGTSISGSMLTLSDNGETGTGTVTVTANDGNETVSLTFAVNIGALGIDDVADHILYPTPSTNGLLTIEWGQDSSPEQIDYQVVDTSGKLWDAGKLTMSGTKYSLNISHLPNGNYFIKLKSGNQEATGKIVLRK